MPRKLFLSLGAAALTIIPLAACSVTETGDDNAAQAQPVPDVLASNDGV